ncbi:MAG: alpha/beta hydrolase [Sinobacteraceae bacterium]|nr:alpha/beta hydrolase [Nevskiaceae bacterium]MBV9318073.1 alpha/beta hydrolase [Gammaproteobacteria bacterium]
MNAVPPAPLTPVVLPARTIEPPTTISLEARAALSLGAGTPMTTYPAPGDLEGWQRALKDSAAIWDPVANEMLGRSRCRLDTRSLGGVSTYLCKPPEADVSGRPLYIYIHGGAFVFGSGRYAMAFGAKAADELGLTTVSVDYRTPPADPFPAALEDCFAVYRELLGERQSRRIIIGGSSAGGNLAAAVTLLIRDRGLELPAAVILLTPEVDLTESGDTFRANAFLDVNLKRGVPECNALYAAGHDLTDPYLSPLYGDFTRGFPPTFIQSGTRDLFLSNSVLMHRKLRRAGIDAELHVWEAMPHASFGFGAVPENEEIGVELRRFIARHC